MHCNKEQATLTCKCTQENNLYANRPSSLILDLTKCHEHKKEKLYEEALSDSYTPRQMSANLRAEEHDLLIV